MLNLQFNTYKSLFLSITDGWINKIWYKFIQWNIIQLIKKMKLIHAIYIMDEPWIHNFMWKKPDPKGHMLHKYIFIKCPKQATL